MSTTLATPGKTYGRVWFCSTCRRRGAVLYVAGQAWVPLVMADHSRAGGRDCPPGSISFVDDEARVSDAAWETIRNGFRPVES